MGGAEQAAVVVPDFRKPRLPGGYQMDGIASREENIRGQSFRFRRNLIEQSL